MEIIRVREREIPISDQNTVVALGFFDGMHAGHAALFARVREEAAATGAIPAVCSFLGSSGIKGDAPRLMHEEERLESFRRAGMARVYLLDFAAVRDMSCEQFCRDVLISAMRCTVAVCGYNFRFGRDGAGDAETLCRLLASDGVRTVVLSPVTHGEGAVSSSAIRAAAEAGDILRANALLGHPLSFSGEVVHGKALGRRIGYPTANLLPTQNVLLPARGVYAVRVDIGDGRLYPAIANVGVRPTVEEGAQPNCEVHLLDFDGDLYGKWLSVYFYHRLRGEMKFDTIDALCARIAADEAKAKEYFYE